MTDTIATTGFCPICEHPTPDRPPYETKRGLKDFSTCENCLQPIWFSDDDRTEEPEESDDDDFQVPIPIEQKGRETRTCLECGKISEPRRSLGGYDTYSQTCNMCIYNGSVV